MIEVSKATIDDVVAILRMHDDMVKERGEPLEQIKSDGRERERWFLKLIDKIYTNTGFVFLAYKGSDVAGFVTGYLWNDGVHCAAIGHCEDLYVKPKFRGKRVAKTLTDAIESAFSEAGADVIEFTEAWRPQGDKRWLRRGYKPKQTCFQREVGK